MVAGSCRRLFRQRDGNRWWFPNDAAVPAKAPPVAQPEVDARVAATDLSVPKKSSICTSTLSSVSTSTLSLTSLSCASSDDDSVAWPEANRELPPHVPSDSNDSKLAAEEDDAAGEREVARRIPK